MVLSMTHHTHTHTHTHTHGFYLLSGIALAALLGIISLLYMCLVYTWTELIQNSAGLFGTFPPHAYYIGEFENDLNVEEALLHPACSWFVCASMPWRSLLSDSWHYGIQLNSKGVHVRWCALSYYIYVCWRIEDLLCRVPFIQYFPEGNATSMIPHK